MKVRRYYVQDMKEGMLRIRKELGPEAVIIQSRKVRRRGLRGLFSPRQVEITAAVGSPQSPEPAEQANGTGLQEKIQKEIGEVRMMVNRLLSRDHMPKESRNQEEEELEKWRLLLQQQDVFSELIEKLLEEIKAEFCGEVQLTKEIIGLVLRQKIRKILKVEPEKSAAIQVFVGPTGVGKTTTLAKLAARYAFYHSERVGIITIDHYRIGAVEQLRTYADIASLPLEVAVSPGELNRALEKLSGCQRILIDTAGRSTLNIPHIQELGGYLQNLPPAEIFMVVSATTKARDLNLICENFRSIKCNRLIITKIDETDAHGALLNSVYLSGLPVIYLATGQNVPEDLCLADIEKMSALILGEAE
ncbi:MAG: flagellar biosynthesis protein FlhF [Firmicutes bacterium]|nr:flagellar biosynthesis protein FlhF [Bacillota bacterium]